MEREYDAARVKQILEIKAQTYFGVPLAEASKTQVYKAVCMTVRDILTEMRLEFKRKRKEQKTKQVYYMSMEFLLGRSLKNHLFNLGMTDIFAEAVKPLGVSMDELYAIVDGRIQAYVDENMDVLDSMIDTAIQDYNDANY